MLRKSWLFTKSYLLLPVAARSCWHRVPAHAMCKKLRVRNAVLAQIDDFCLLLLISWSPAFLPWSWCLRGAGWSVSLCRDFTVHAFFCFLIVWLSSAACNKKDRAMPRRLYSACNPFFMQKVPREDRGGLCDRMVNKNGVTTPGYGFMHFYWSQISKEIRLVAAMMIITNNACSPWILADCQDRLPDEEMHMSVSSVFKVSARHHFLQLQRAADENMHQEKQSGSTRPRLLSLLCIIVLISVSQTLASQISEQLCQVLTVVAAATQKPGGF